MLGAIVGAVAPAIIGGLFDSKQKKSDRSAVVAQNREQRAWQNEDWKRDRLAFQSDRSNDRAWAIQQLNNQRAYDRQMLGYERKYDRQLLDDARIYEQRQIDRQVASRGIDFTKLREQAIAAGFNPLTVLGNAGAYSTERALGQANLLGRSASGGGGGVSYGGTSFVSGGGGYQQHALPPLAGGGFVAEAIQRGVDTYFNTPAPTDPLADALRSAMASEAEAEKAKREQVPKSFGYDLTVNRPFEAAAVSGLPPVSAASAKVARTAPPTVSAAPKRPVPNPSKQSFINVRLPDGQMGQIDATIARREGIEPYDTLSAGDWTQLRGEIVGEAEVTVQFDPIARTAIGRTGMGNPIEPEPEAAGKKVYPPKMRNPKPQSGWMDDFFK